MMMKIHINNETGDVSECSATVKCPFGDLEKDHYTSKEAAREAYEKRNNAALVSTLKTSEKNELAKTVTSPEVINTLIATGSARTLGNLAKNEALTKKQLLEALRKAGEGTAARAALLKNPKAPVTAYSPVEFEARIKSLGDLSPHESPLKDLINSPDVTTEQMDHLLKKVSENRYYPNRFAIVSMLSKKNQVSQAYIEDYLERNDYNVNKFDAARALANGKISEKILNEAPDSFLASAVPYNTVSMKNENREKLIDAALKRGLPETTESLLKRDDLTPGELDTLALTGFNPERVYTHPNVDDSTQAYLENKHKSEPFVKVAVASRASGKTPKEYFIIESSSKSLGRSYSETTLAFDMKKVREHNLNNDDIFYLANAKGFNAGGGFDSETGIFTARLDTGD